MHILPFGSNGFFPSFGRQTMCFVILYGETLIILDAGTGLFRLAEKDGQKLLKGVKRVHLFLSHYHLDHTFGFYGAFKLFKDKKVVVFSKEKRPVFSEIAPAYFPVDYKKEHQNFIWRKISQGKHNIDDYTVMVRKQAHGGWGSLAFRFSFSTKTKNQNHLGVAPLNRDSPEVKGSTKTLAYITDSEPSEAGIEFVKGVNLLLHEHWLSGFPLRHPEPRLAERRIPSDYQELDSRYELGHVTTVGAATVAKEAKVDKLALAHHYPFADNNQLGKQLKLAQSIFPQTVLAWDLQKINF